MTTTDGLAGFVRATFGLNAVGCRAGNRGALGRIWRLDTADRPYAVKELFASAPPDPRVIAAEVEFTELAAAAGVRVPRSLPAQSGDYAIAYGDRWIRVYDWLDLTPVDPGIVATDLGRLLATLHVGAPFSSLEPDGTPPDRFFEVPPPVDRWARPAGAATDWALRLSGLVSRIEQLTSLATPAASATMRTCHRDLHPENVMRCEAALAVVDWDNLGPAVPGRELAKVLFDWYCADDALDEVATRRCWQAYIDAGGPGRIEVIADFGMLIAARLNFLDRQIGIALDATSDPDHRSWAVKEIDEALAILPSVDAFERVLDIVG